MVFPDEGAGAGRSTRPLDIDRPRPSFVMVLGLASLEVTTSRVYIGPELALLSEASLWSLGPVVSRWFPGAVLTSFD